MQKLNSEKNSCRSSITLDEALRDEFEKLAKKIGISKSAFIRKALRVEVMKVRNRLAKKRAK